MLTVFEEFVLGLTLLGDIRENHREGAHARAVGVDLEVAPQHIVELLETHDLTMERHLAIALDPMVLNAGDGLAHAPSDQIGALQSGQGLERPVDVDEAVVDGMALVVEDDLVQGEPLAHGLEQRTIARLALTEQLDRLGALHRHGAESGHLEREVLIFAQMPGHGQTIDQEHAQGLGFVLEAQQKALA